ncbi:hypothetical protein TNCV_298771 [Trichonephila clavipes]|nr:hypothetical protein TNCV_298771 [Trichonephila clavipes]
MINFVGLDLATTSAFCVKCACDVIPRFGCGRVSLVVRVSDRGWHETSSNSVPQKTRRVICRELKRPPVGVVVRRGGCQLRCRPHHLTMVQNCEIRRQHPFTMIWFHSRHFLTGQGFLFVSQLKREYIHVRTYRVFPVYSFMTVFAQP